MRFRTRLALLVRTIASIGVLLPVAVLLWALFTVLFAMLPLLLLEQFHVLSAVMFLYEASPAIDLPTPSALAGVSPAIVFSVAVLAVACFVGLLVGRDGDRIGVRLLYFGGAAVAGAVVVLETVAVLSTGNPLLLYLVLVGLPVGAYAVIRFWRWVLRKAIGNLRDAVLAERVDPDARPELESTVRRLAMQADVQPPTVAVIDRERPESYTLGPSTDPILVVSTGLLERLEEREVTAVLAHELAHLTNDDLRIMETLLLPLVFVTDLTRSEDDSDTPLTDWFCAVALSPFRFCAQFAVAVFAVGRERAADHGAVALCGEPAALAAALETLDDARGTPETDLRSWERRTAAMDILPPDEAASITGQFSTHPATETRIRWLRDRAARSESEP
ncbi:M48 family metallopeptidase [Halopiger goleimassiliensis]|uniref:M48 family metallopeptidase n=1 Tax=Halopiger goleimassiliensis TaxID=1293048 RepID=UPI000678007A|nr:M48 family metalloprotease [Halopiger goleimassiliensis]